MKFSELKKTHEEITETATVGKKGYAKHGDEVKTWNGDCWDEGRYILSGDEMTHKVGFDASDFEL